MDFLPLNASALLDEYLRLPHGQVLARARLDFPEIPPRDPLDAILPWPDAMDRDRVILALACIADRPGVAITLLHRRPELVNARCTPWSMWVRYRNPDSRAVFFENMPPLLAAITAGSWKTATALVFVKGIDVVSLWNAGVTDLPFGEDPRLPGDTVLADLFLYLTHEEPVPVAHGLHLATLLMEQGASLLGSNQDGTTPLSTLWNALASGVYDKTRFKDALAMVEFALDRLSKDSANKVLLFGQVVLEKMESALEAMRSSIGHLQMLEWAQNSIFCPPPPDAQVALLQEKTGTRMHDFHDTLMVFLVQRSIALPALAALVGGHSPATLGWVEQGRLEETLPLPVGEAENPGPRPPCRL
jgi:hypothetical protein